MENEEVFRSARQLSLFEDVCAPLQGTDTGCQYNSPTISRTANLVLLRETRETRKHHRPVLPGLSSLLYGLRLCTYSTPGQRRSPSPGRRFRTAQVNQEVSNIFRINRLAVHPVNGPHYSSLEDETPGGTVAGDPHCPGIAGENSLDFKTELERLLKIAEGDGAEARKQGLKSIRKEGSTTKCVYCGKTGRRDGLLAHVIYNHLALKTWACPLWCVCLR